jgi:Tol biopolymer transport system component
VWPLGVSDQGSYYYMIEAQSSEVLVARVNVVDGTILEQPRRITSTAGASESPDWSPDGRWLAWRTVPPPFSLVVRDTVSGDERALSSVSNVGPGPRWSPDGRSLLVRAGEGSTRGLYIVDVQSGTLRGPFLKTRPIGEYVWHPGGRAAFLLDFRTGVSLLDFRSGSEKRVYTPPSGWSHGRGLALSPDGKKLAAVLIKDGTFVISVITLGTQVTREILRIQRPDVISLGHWTRDGHSVTYIKGRTVDGVSAEPRGELWAAPAAGDPPRYLNIAMDGLQDVRMHADGERIAFKTGGRRRELWVLDNVLSGRATHR